MKKALALILALAMILSFAACGEKGGQTASTQTLNNGQGSAAATAKENIADSQIVKTVYADETSDWNPLHPSSANTWCNYIDSLVEYDNFGLCQPCLAESWTKETFDWEGEEAQRWVFNVREGVKWQTYDGKQYEDAYVTAEDWRTTFKWILDPANTAMTADLIDDVIGAWDYYEAMQQWEDGAIADQPNFDDMVHIYADGQKLTIELESVCPWFLSRLTYNWGYPTYGPYLEEMGDKFGTNNQTFLYCGAYLCTEWEMNSYTLSKKNPEYWDKEDIYIEEIQAKFNAEANTLAPSLLLSGEITSCDIPNDQVDEWMNDPEKAKLIRPNRPSSYPYFYLIDCKPAYEEKTMEDGYTLDCAQWTAAANNLNFRKSLYYGLDRVKAVSCYDKYSPESYVIRTITPPNFCAANGVDYTMLPALKEYTETDQFQADKAKEYAAKAKEELTAQGVSFPIIAYMPYNAGDPNHTNIAIVVSQQLEELFGSDYIHFELEGYPDTDFLATTRRPGNYSFMMSYWGPDFADPLTYTDPFALGQAYNYIWHLEGWATQTDENDPEGRKGRNGFDETYWKDFNYQNLVDAASEETVDLDKRYTMFSEAEAWLLDTATVIPLATLNGCGYMASYTNPFESQYAAFGMSEDRYKYQVLMKAPMNTEEYEKLLPVWEKERAERISKAQEAGIDY